MTVATEAYRTSATGSATVGQEIAFTFPVNTSADLKVYKRVTTTGVETLMTLTTDYTVAVTGDTGGTVTTVEAIAATYTIVVVRDTAITQTLDLTQGGAFNAELLEDAVDKLTRINAEMSRINSDGTPRFLRIPETDADNLDMELPNSVDRASQYLAFNAAGNPTVVASVAPDTATISSYIETLLAATSAATAQTAIGISAFAQTILDDAAATNVFTTLGVTAFAKTLLDDAAASNARTTLELGTAATLASVDEDDMASNSAVKLPTQQSVKAYIDAKAVHQMVYQADTAVATGTTLIPYDDTTPQVSEGDEVMDLAITPVSSTSKLKIDVTVNVAHTVAASVITAALHLTGTGCVAACSVYVPAVNVPIQITFSHYRVSGTAAVEEAYTVRVGSNTAGTLTFNGVSGGRKLAGKCESSIAIMEIL